MIKRTCFAVVLVAVILVAVPAARSAPPRAQAASPAQAPMQQPRNVIYVAQWGIARADWAAFEDNTRKNLIPVLAKLLTQGTLHGWGFARRMVHDESGVTHVLWWSASSVGNLLRAEDELLKVPAVAAPPVNITKHFDIIVQTVAGNGKPSSGVGYFTVGYYHLRPGAFEGFLAVFKKEVAPALDPLVADGTLSAYGLDTEVIHTTDPASVFAVLAGPSPDSVDKARAALEAVLAKSPSVEGAVAALTHTSDHRDQLYEIFDHNIK